MNKVLLIALIGFSGMYLLAFGQQQNVVLSSGIHADSPVELGSVNWLRDLEKAKELSSESGKPLFVQFQEVPG